MSNCFVWDVDDIRPDSSHPFGFAAIPENQDTFSVFES
jgi:hypothetical protein